MLDPTCRSFQLAFQNRLLPLPLPCPLPACKKMGQECTNTCCPTEGTCVLAGTTGKRRCTKPPTLAASPVASLTATAASGLASATVKLAAAPVTSANGGGVLGANFPCTGRLL